MLKLDIKFIKKSFKGIVLILLLVSFFSCKSREKLVYFNQSKIEQDSLEHNNRFLFDSGDLLSIHVSSSDLEAIKPFNLESDRFTIGNPANEGYLIDINGEINFPFIGKIKVSGLDRVELTNLIALKLKKYVVDPVVNVRLVNFKITILGAVNNPGTYNISDDNITILEAIGLARDLKITGQRTNVLLIREKNGKRLEYKFDLTSKELFKSPAYFLKQNDIIYVEPNVAERFASSILKNNSTAILTSISVLLSFLNLIVK